MSELSFSLKHDGGTHRVEIENQGDTCVIRFGASFTLRLDEGNLNKLLEHIHDAACDMLEQQSRLTATQHYSSEVDFIQAGIDAREQLKVKRVSETQAVDVFDYNPNDPANW